MLDQRLFNQEQYSGSFADDDSYNLYDRPLFQGSSAAAAIYKPMSNNNGEDEPDAGTEEGIKRAMQNDRFDLGVASKGFAGASDQEVSSSRLYKYSSFFTDVLLPLLFSAPKRTRSIRERHWHCRSLRCRRLLGSSQSWTQATGRRCGGQQQKEGQR